MIDTRWCLICGYPAEDHVPLRAAVKCWIAHRPWVWRSELVLFLRRHA